MQLMHGVKPLQEHRTTFVRILRTASDTAAIGKLVPECQPLLLNQHAETLETKIINPQIIAQYFSLSPTSSRINSGKNEQKCKNLTEQIT